MFFWLKLEKQWSIWRCNRGGVSGECGEVSIHVMMGKSLGKFTKVKTGMYPKKAGGAGVWRSSYIRNRIVGGGGKKGDGRKRCRVEYEYLVGTVPWYLVREVTGRDW